MGKIRQQSPSQGRSIRADTNGTGSTQAELVRFCFKHFEHSCIDRCSVAQIRAFTKTLAVLSSMTWQQVTQSGRHQLGCEKIGRAQLRIPCTLSADVTFLLAFRFDGKRPMLGHRNKAALQLVWLDADFTAYDHD